MKIPIIPITPLTDETFKRQGWKKFKAIEIEDAPDGFNLEEFDEIDEIEESDEIDDIPYYWTLNIPKSRKDQYSPMIISSLSDGNGKNLKPGHYFVDIFDLDGLGFCSSEEELEILYYSLTKKNIEDD